MLTPKQKLELYREAGIDIGAAFLKALELLRGEVQQQLTTEVQKIIPDLEKNLTQKIPDLKSVLAAVKGEDGKDATPEEVAQILLQDRNFVINLKPRDGHTPTTEELTAIIKPLIPEVRDGIPGKQGEPGPAPTHEELIALIESVMKPEEESEAKQVNLKEEARAAVDAALENLKLLTQEEVIKIFDSRPIDASRVTGLSKLKGKKYLHGGGLDTTSAHTWTGRQDFNILGVNQIYAEGATGAGGGTIDISANLTSFGDVYNISGFGTISANFLTGDGSGITNILATNFINRRYVHLLTGVTGLGTSANPYIGFDTTLEASAGGETWFMIEGVFQTDGTELDIIKSNVNIIGSGRGTILRSTHSTAGKAIVRFGTVANGNKDLFGVGLSHITLDGNGVTKYGLFADNTLSSNFEDIEYINMVDWGFVGTRGISNIYKSWNMWASRMTTVTANGFWFGSTDSANSDQATTVSTMENLYVSGLAGTSSIGFKVGNVFFGNKFIGGSAENVAINLKMDSTCTSNSFDCLDLESSSGAGVQIDGAADKNIFSGNEMTATTTTISAGSGSNVFNNLLSFNCTDNSTGVNIFYNCDPSPLGTNTKNLHYSNTAGNDGGRAIIKKGVNIQTFYSSLTASTVGIDLFVAGETISGMYSLAGGSGLYFVQGGGMADYTTATIQANAAMKILGLNVTVFGTLTSGSQVVTGTGVRKISIDSTNAFAAVSELFSGGAVLGYMAAESNALYFSANGSLAYDHTTLESEYAIKILNTGKTGFGINPTSIVHLKAGSTAANTAPLQYTSGSLETTARAGVREYNGNHYATNGAAIRFPLGGVLFDHFADVGNSTTTETDLYSDTLAANTFNGNGDKIYAEYGGTFVSSATATRQIKIKFAGTTMLDTGALTLTLSSAWTAYVSLIRVSSTVVRYMISLTTEGAALAAYTAVGELTGLTLSGTNILKITGQAASTGAATNDIVAKMGFVEFRPAA